MVTQVTEIIEEEYAVVMTRKRMRQQYMKPSDIRTRDEEATFGISQEGEQHCMRSKQSVHLDITTLLRMDTTGGDYR